MSTSKKFHREKDAFSSGYMQDVEEELGDTLWYVSALSRRLNLRLTDLFADALDGVGYSTSIAANADPDHPVAKVFKARDLAPLDAVLLRLGVVSARLLQLEMVAEKARPLLIDFIAVYLETVQTSPMSFAAVLNGNIAKARGRFLLPVKKSLPDFDAKFSIDE